MEFSIDLFGIFELIIIVVRERKLFLLAFSSSIGSNTSYTLCKITYLNLSILSLKYVTGIASRNTIYRLKLKNIQYLYLIYLLDIA